ncbi:formate dehydrogenase accessory sulfurtransferase FdhD [Chloroflexota bacterium]
MMFSVFVNGQELVTILCTPEKLNCLVIGYLLSEGFITCLNDIAMMLIRLEESLADVHLTRQPADIPTRRILTSGCGNGISFDPGTNIQLLSSRWRVSPSQILSSLALLHKETQSQSETGSMRRGVHVSALSDGNELLVRAEDIGRHNTLGKIWGECMLRKIPTEDSLLLTTGRISSGMLSKAAKMGVTMVASLKSATDRAVKLGTILGITIVGHARGNRFSVYCCENRLFPSGD